MSTLFLTTSSIMPKESIKFKDQHKFMLNDRKKSVVYCQERNTNAKVSKQTSMTVSADDHLVSSAPIRAKRVPNGIGIAKFLSGKNILVTGATGFFAKVLIEKILRAAPDVGMIYLLIRAKNKEAAEERLKHEIINVELFKRLQQTYGESYQTFMLSKLVPVVGNVCESNLALEDDAADLIAEEVDVIVNSAANTNFHERYDVALETNTEGAKHLISFAKRCKELKLFLQVSTAYVNGERQGRVMENPLCIGDNIAREMLVFGTPQIAVPVLDVESEIKLAFVSKETYGDNAVAQKMKKLGLERANKYGWQDTYVFTKAMGEMVIENMRGDIPMVIVRPSIIESSYREPFPGWIEGNRMIDPIIQMYGKGLITSFVANPNGVFDVVPVDMVVNATLAAMAKHGAAGRSGINVYQTASSWVNPLVIQDCFTSFYEHFNSMPLLDSKGRPIYVKELNCVSSMNDFSAQFLTDAFVHQLLTARAMPRKLEMFRRKLVEHAKQMAGMYKPYTYSYGGRFDNSNTQELMECMSEEERREFGFDVRSIDWKHYMENVHVPGLRRHVMKERIMTG